MATIADIATESSERSEADAEPITVSLTDNGAVFGVLSSQTARTILSLLSESSSTASELAETVDTSIQNVHYHLDRLQSVDLIDEVGKTYSKRGREMTRYGVAGPCYIVVGMPSSEDEIEITAESCSSRSTAD